MRRAATLAVALALAGCGSSSLSTSQLRTRARRICAGARRRADRIPTPSSPAQTSAYLEHGLAALRPELAALRRLRAPSDFAGEYREGLDALGAEVVALRVAVTRLAAGDDAVVAIRTLQQQLAPDEAQTRRMWSALELPSCVDP
jgi:hypothetical protein